jgi:hypothetical protein
MTCRMFIYALAYSRPEVPLVDKSGKVRVADKREENPNLTQQRLFQGLSLPIPGAVGSRYHRARML